MSKRVKVSDLRNVEEREVPLLKYVPSRKLVHISRKCGCWERSGYDITDCNLVLKYAWTYRWPLDEMRLCPRCGDRAQFEKARREYSELVERDRRERDEKIERQMQKHEAEMQAMSLRLIGLKDFLELGTLGSMVDSSLTQVKNGDGYTRAIRFEYGGYVYEVQEVEE